MRSIDDIEKVRVPAARGMGSMGTAQDASAEKTPCQRAIDDIFNGIQAFVSSGRGQAPRCILMPKRFVFDLAGGSEKDLPGLSDQFANCRGSNFFEVIEREGFKGFPVRVIDGDELDFE